jgi:DNA helicase-2/ATP-dependent DNA helicase PcrA
MNARNMEQARVDDVVREISQKEKIIKAKTGDIKDSVVKLRRDFWDDVRINLDEPEEAIETHASIKQQAELLSERERSHGQLHEQIKTLQTLKESPYFARIDFLENCETTGDPIYIGLASFMDSEDENFLIYDWRAPISSLYYDYALGAAEYETMNGKVTGEVLLKRQFIIKNGLIEGMFDTGITIGDHLLQQALGNNASSTMKSIVATIQKEQNKIIRNETSKYLVVQGAAGSGKTSAALQRVAYLMYRYREVLTANNMILFSPNPLFSSYVSHVLPELGEVNLQQTTFLQYLSKNIENELAIESPFEQMEYILTTINHKDDDTRMKNIALKSSVVFKAILDEFILSLGKEGIVFHDIIFREEILISKEEINDHFYTLAQDVTISNAIGLTSTWLLKKISVLEELEMNEDWVMDEVELLDDEEYLQAYQYAQEQEEIEEFYNSGDEEEYLKEEVVKRSFAPLRESIQQFEFVNIFETYQQLFGEWAPKNKPDHWNEISEYSLGKLSQMLLTWEEATPYLYVKDSILGGNADRSIRHLFIDEAQDYTAFQLAYIKHTFPYTRMTFLGDVNQAIYAHTTEGNPLQSEFEGGHDRIELTKSYRSTKQIVEFTKYFSPTDSPVQPFERNGEKPQLIDVNHVENIPKQLIFTVQELTDHGHETIAIICKTFAECDLLYDQLKDEIDLKRIDESSTTFEKGILILPIFLAKGIEFDAVIIPDASDSQYHTALDQSLLYTACTRAMHELVMLIVGDYSSFIKKAPIDKYNISRII